MRTRAARSPRRRLLRALPWVAIPAIIAVVQLVRGELIDAAVFAVVAALLALDLTGLVPEPRPRRLPLAPVLAAAVVVAAALTLAPRHSTAAGVVVVLVGLTVALVGWPPTPDASTTDARAADRGRIVRGGVLWASVAVALCLWELASFLLGRDSEAAKLAHPAVSDLLDPPLDTAIGRTVFVVLWVAAGVGLVRAGRRA